VVIPVPKGTRSRDLEVIIKKNYLKVALKGQEPICEVSFLSDIEGDDKHLLSMVFLKNCTHQSQYMEYCGNSFLLFLRVNYVMMLNLKILPGR